MLAMQWAVAVMQCMKGRTGDIFMSACMGAQVLCAQLQCVRECICCAVVHCAPITVVAGNARMVAAIVIFGCMQC